MRLYTQDATTVGTHLIFASAATGRTPVLLPLPLLRMTWDGSCEAVRMAERGSVLLRAKRPIAAGEAVPYSCIL